MTGPVRIVGVGQAAAGDDGVGLAVVEALRAMALPAGVELHRVAEPIGLLPLLSTDAEVIIVDAVLGEPVGEVLELSPHELATLRLCPVSTHGLGVAEALRLASAIAPGSSGGSVRLIAIRIARPRAYRMGLSPEVSEAAQRAVKWIHCCLNSREGPRTSR